MPREGAIKVEGIVVEVLKETLVRVELPNQHRLTAYLAGKELSCPLRLVPGDKVTVEMSPYDLSIGRVTADRDFC